jgi:uncharacterized protein (TIRG00374 family)
LAHCPPLVKYAPGQTYPKDKPVKKRLRVWIGVAISLVGLWLALHGVDFRKLGQALAGANYWWLIPALVIHLLSVVTRSERWRVLLGADQVDSVTAFWVMNLGYLISNVLPLRIGDPARAVIIAQRCRVGVPRALSTVVVERVFDVLATVLGLVLLIPFMQLPADAQRWVRVFGGLGLLAILGIIVLLTQRALTERILAALLSRIPRLSPDKWLERWHNLMSGFDALGSARGVLVVTAWTLASWVTTLGVFWAVMQAFFPGVSWVPPTFVMCVQGFGMAVPATGGNWGVFEVIGRVGLVAPFGFPETQAVSYTLVLHFFEYLAINVVGVIALMRYSLSLGQISAAAQQVAAPTEEA